jgi:hypothetical protein
MGRNFHSLCHACEVQLMHLRGQEGKTLHRFADDHYAHKHMTSVIDDYVQAPPESYKDVYDEYHKLVEASSPKQEQPHE